MEGKEVSILPEAAGRAFSGSKGRVHLIGETRFPDSGTRTWDGAPRFRLNSHRIEIRRGDVSRPVRAIVGLA